MKHVGFWLPDQGLNWHLLHWKAESNRWTARKSQWVNFKNHMLSEKSQTPKTTYYMISFTEMPKIDTSQCQNLFLLPGAEGRSWEVTNH